jgi:hypothetical protein
MKKPLKPSKKSIIDKLAKSYYPYDAKEKCNFITTFPCPKCDCKGRIHDPNDQPDPVEGYKMVNKITCPLCSGKGHIPKALHDKNFNKIVNENYNFAMKIYNENRLKYNTLQGILKKCSPKEKSFIIQYVR